MKYVLEIVNDIERVSGITTFSNNFFEHKKLCDIKRKTVNSNPSFDLFKKIFKSQTVYCHILYSIHFPIIVLACSFFRKKLIIVSHGNLIIIKKSKIKKRIFLAIVKVLSKFANVTTQFLNKREFERSVKITNKHLICPPFLMVKAYQPKENVTSGNRFVYMGASYYDRKGFDRMFQICAALRKEGRVCSLDLVGVTPSEEIDQAIRHYKLKGIVNYLAPIFGDEKFILMTKYDALLLLSRSEGWPMVVLESINVRLPVIVSEETNIADTVIKFSVGLVCSDFSSARNAFQLDDLEMRCNEMLLNHNNSKGFEEIRKEFLSP